MKCTASLIVTEHAARCSACGATWPVVGGVPRFAGEQTRSSGTDADQHYANAAARGWRSAMLDHLPPDEQYANSAYNWHGAPWVSLLRIPDHAVALNIGVGVGGIAEALSRIVDEVIVVDLDPQRVALGKLRMDQEAVGNVRVVQASGADLPFHDETFDLIVVTGPLEWVAAEHPSLQPHIVEQAAYTALYRKLRPGGILVVGLENRYGNQFFRRDITSPHWASTLFGGNNTLAVNGRTHGRRHSRRALAALLRTSGFRDADFFWADPDHEHPYHLIPLSGSLPGLHIHAKLNEPSQSVRRGWRRRLKGFFARSGMVRNFVGSFLVLSHRPLTASDAPLRHRLWSDLRAAMPQLPKLTDPVYALFTHARSTKSLLRVYDAGRELPDVILKATTTAPKSLESVNAEYDALVKASVPQATLSDASFTVPRPMGRCALGKVVYTAEAAIRGVPLSFLMFSPTSEDRIELVRRHLQRVRHASVDISRMLREIEVIPRAGHRWYEVPKEFEGRAAIARMSETARREQQATADAAPCSHHGDFTVENVFDVDGTTQVAVIDWADMVRGTPPLYDMFTALLSTLPAVGSDTGENDGSGRAWVEWFATAFFGSGPWATLFRDTLRQAATQFGVRDDQVWPQFCQFLLARTHYFAERGSGVRTHQMEFLEIAAERSADFILPA